MRFPAAGVLLLLLACYPTTTRPHLVPMPDAATVEVQGSVPEATRALALALDGDSIPIERTEPLDGWLETGWFDAATLLPVDKREFGLGAVKLRGFVDPGPRGESEIFVEVVYRPLANPALPERELERMVPMGHPVLLRVERILKVLGGGVDSAPTEPAQPPVQDSTGADSTAGSGAATNARM